MAYRQAMIGRQRRAVGARGDLFGTLKGIGSFLVKKAAPVAVRSVPGIGPIAGIAIGALGTKTAVGAAQGLVARGTQLAHQSARAVQSGLTGSPCGSGYHLDKQTRSRCVRNRKMNYSNIRATKRAVRRIKGAEKVFRQILQVQGKKATGIKPRTRR